MLASTWLTSKPMFTADKQVMRGKTVIITGANAGIGLETTVELARYGARIIMACRNLDKANAARTNVIDRIKNQAAPNAQQSSFDHSDIDQRIIVKQLDLASLKNVRAFAEDILKSETRLDVLINNAGVSNASQRNMTEDGLEMVIACNHFGHFLLTNLLLPLLKKSAPSRIVVLTSAFHMMQTEFDLDNVNSEKQFYPRSVYNMTKLANVYFTRHLAKLLDGTNVIVNSVHPGFVHTDLVEGLPAFRRYLFRIAQYMLAITPLQGAQTSIYLAASDDPQALVTGRYFSNMKEDQVSKLAEDAEIAARLWQLSEKLTGLRSAE